MSGMSISSYSFQDQFEFPRLSGWSEDNKYLPRSESIPYGLHARLKLMNAYLFTININLDAARHIGNMPNTAIFHFDHEVVAFHKHNLAVLHIDFLCGISGSGCPLRLYLGIGSAAKAKQITVVASTSSVFIQLLPDIISHPPPLN
jgi:hypothetical protein